MEVKEIAQMIDNSIWKNVKTNTCFKFIEGNNILIDGQDPLQYTLRTRKNKIIMEVGQRKKYNVEYVNDFVLDLYNETEGMRIMLD